MAAQNGPPTETEYRIDGFAGRNDALQVGAGATLAADVYTRIGIIAATGVGTDWHSTSSTTRVDVLARFLVDPLRQASYGLSLGGGLSVANTQNGRWRPYLVGILDVEGAGRGPVVPAVQLGLGGGFRVGFVLRTTASGWR